MRKLKRDQKNKKWLTFVVIIVASLLIMASGYAIFNITLTVNGHAQLVTLQANHCDGSLTGSFVMDSNSWADNGSSPVLYNSVGHLTLNNGGAEAIYNLDLELKGSSDMSATAYKVEIHANSSGIIKSNDFFWNSTIGAGEEKTYDIAFKSYTPIADIKYVKINGCVIYTDGSEIVSNDTTESTQAGETTTQGVAELYHLAFDPSAVSMSEGETLQLHAIKTPANSNIPLTWTSSDFSVASVSSTGVVTAQSAGTATITVSANGLSATCTVTVSPVFNITDLSASFSNNAVYGSTMHFSVSVSNTTGFDINNYRIRINLPNDCTYSSWGAFSFDGNEIVSTQSPALQGNSSVTLQGAIDFPSSYLEEYTNEWGGTSTRLKSQYENPTVTIIAVN